MKKLAVFGLIAILLVNLMAAPTFAGKPDNPGNSNKTEKSEKSDKADKEDKDNKEDKNTEDTAETEDTTADDASDTDTADDDEEKVVVNDEDTSNKVGSFLNKWKKRYEAYNGEEDADTEEEASDDTDESEEGEEAVTSGKGKSGELPPGLAKKGEDLPPGLAAKEVLPYGLLKRIDPDAIPPGQVTDEITGEEIDIERLLADSVNLLESAVEGDELGQYFEGSIEDYDEALTAYTDLVNAGEATEEELAAAAEELNDAYNDFIMSRTATVDELTEYNTFLEEVDDIIEDLEIGTEEGQISAEDYDALVAYFDTLEPFNVVTDDEEGLTPDSVSIEAMLTLFDNATTNFDEFMGYEEPAEEEGEDTTDSEDENNETEEETEE